MQSPASAPSPPSDPANPKTASVVHPREWMPCPSCPLCSGAPKNTTLHELQTGDRSRATDIRGARMARLPPPCHAVHRGLRIPGLREGDDSPLWILCHHVLQGTCHSQRLPTQRLRLCEPNDTSRTRSRPCADA